MNKLRLVFGMAGAGLAAAVTMPALAQPEPGDCSALADADLPNVRIIGSEPIASGAFKNTVSSTDPDLGGRMSSLPEFCRVRAEALPSPDSKIEIWLPFQDWNGRLLASHRQRWRCWAHRLRDGHDRGHEARLRRSQYGYGDSP